LSRIATFGRAGGVAIDSCRENLAKKEGEVSLQPAGKQAVPGFGTL